MTVLAPASRKAARRVGHRAHLVDDLRAYATRAIFRVKKTVGRAPAEEEQLPEAGWRPNRQTTRKSSKSKIGF